MPENSSIPNQSEEYLNGLKGTTRVRIHVHKSLLQPTTTMLALNYRCDATAPAAKTSLLN